jgi:hypothetical protein
MEVGGRAQCAIAMPAIYRFNIEQFPMESGWGWVYAQDLLAAVRCNHWLQGDSEAQYLTANQVQHRYSQAFILDKILTRIDALGILARGGDKDEWFHNSVQHGEFIPARIATDLLKLVKAGGRFTQDPSYTLGQMGQIK